jgi:hypothetical protein
MYIADGVTGRVFGHRRVDVSLGPAYYLRSLARP